MFSHLLDRLFSMRREAWILRGQVKTSRRHEIRLALEELEKRLAPATFYWVGGGDKTWSNPAHWLDSKNKPGAGDTVVFDGNAETDSIMDAAFGNKIANIKISPGFGAQTLSINAPLTVTSTLILNDENGKLVTDIRGTGPVQGFSINTFYFQGGKTGGNGIIYISTGLNWSGGVMGISATITLPESISIFSGVDDRLTMINNELINKGTVLLSATLLLNESRLSNQGSFMVLGHYDVDDEHANGVGQRSSFFNEGTVSKWGAGESQIKTNFNTIGKVNVVNVYAGKLTIAGPALLQGKFYVAESATLAFQQSALRDVAYLLPGVSFSGTGWVLDQGKLLIPGGMAVRIPNFELAGVGFLSGILGGLGTLSVHYFKWTGGSMEDPGQTLIYSGDKMEISGTDPKDIIERKLAIQGQATWQGTGNIQTDQGARIIVDGPAALFSIQTGSKITVIFGGQQPPSSLIILKDRGVLRKQGEGKTTIEIPTQNFGGVFDDKDKVDFQAGYFQFSGKTVIQAGGFMNVIGGQFNQLGGILQIIGTLQGGAAPIKTAGGEVDGTGRIVGTVWNSSQ
jgi:hypothetical protein